MWHVHELPLKFIHEQKPQVIVLPVNLPTLRGCGDLVDLSGPVDPGSGLGSVLTSAVCLSWQEVSGGAGTFWLCLTGVRLSSNGPSQLQ